MYNKNEIASYKTRLDDDKECIYKYYVIETNKEMDVDGKKLSVSCYGIDVISELYEKGKLCSSFEDSINYLTPFLGKVLKLIDYLKDNGVSPLHLIDIAGEYADEWVGDFDIEVYLERGEISAAV
ncbi:hypothetical protein SAMN05443428_10885 [Caloramator quimbayensis]|uniref:Uncharacterized protein n=1 Tax=Caloramator quimbayensis TaxID=1147123 RepID=A0A1T4XFU3_9CLOT|nr:DUF6514 family protein [Caloramator quimbayensis]SKA87951.1 hypothetical protein SAMN05443428_10885 [Caloramator quimbayensis]